MIKKEGLTIYNSNNNDYICDSKHIIFIPEGCDYSYTVKKNGLCYQINFLISNAINGIQCFELNNPEIIKLFIESAHYYEIDPSNTTIQLSILYEIFVNILNSLEKGEDYLSFAIEIMNKEISNSHLDNAYIASKINISEVYLRKIFKKHLNTSPRQYLIKLRMERALNLLFKNISIKEISHDVGYDSIYSFSRAFKSIYKQSPQQYIKNF